MRQRTIIAWFVVHQWSSLVCTAFLLMLCVTGLPLIFHDEMEARLNPAAALAAVPKGSREPSLDDLVARAVASHPGEVPLYLSFDEDRPVVNVTTAPRADAPTAAMHFVSLDRRTGALLPPKPASFMDILLHIHTDLTLGSTAELFLGAMGMLFLLALVSGVVLYVPFMARLPFATVRHDRSARVTRLDRHNLLGIVTLLWATVVGFTGTLNTLAVPLTNLWKADQLVHIAASGGEAESRRPPVPVARAVRDALRAASGTRPQFLAFPGAAYSSNRHLAIYLQGGTPLTRRLLTPVFVNAATGRIDAVGHMPWYMAALLLAQPLHFGDYGGLPFKIAWALLDLLTIAVLWTGLRLWLGRGVHQVRAKSASAAPISPP